MSRNRDAEIRPRPSSPRLHETDAEDGERSGLYAIAVTAKSKVVAAVYFDGESDIETAMELIDSLAAK